MNRLLLMLDTAVKGAENFENWGFAENLSESLKISGLGMGTIFSVLIILWIVLELFRVVFYDIPKKRANGGVSKKPEKPAAATPVTVAQKTNDEEIVAAITVAISCMMDKPVSSFRVVSFRKTGTK